MKKIKLCIFTMLFVMSVFALTACRRNTGDGTINNSQTATQSTNQTTTQPSNQTATQGVNESSMDGSASTHDNRAAENGRTVEESSTGVIDGVVDGVERGVDNLMDKPTETHRADESR